ncbi:MAG: ABC transporter substrate-binding protein [Gammaproteobacteria bacterium]
MFPRLVPAWLILAACCVASPWMNGAARAAEPLEKPALTLAVGGQALFYYLPLTIAERKGFFADAGLDVTIVDFPGGAKSLQALVGGSADIAAGSFEHVVHMRARGQRLQAIALLARYPLIVLAVSPSLAKAYRAPADLIGHPVGITAPGSSTHLFLNSVLARAGVSPTAVPVLGVGAGAGAVAAMRRGEIDALVHLDPVIHLLESTGAATAVIDTRTPEGARAVYGGEYHAACLYAKETFLAAHPRTAMALVAAQDRALAWLASAREDAILAVLPEAFIAGDPAEYRAALAKNRAAWPPDARLSRAGAENVVRALAAFEPFVRDAQIEVDALIDPRFAAAARGGR